MLVPWCDWWWGQARTLTPTLPGPLHRFLGVYRRARVVRIEPEAYQ